MILQLDKWQGLWSLFHNYILKSESYFFSSSSNDTWEYKPPLAFDIPIDFRCHLERNAPNPLGVLGSKARLTVCSFQWFFSIYAFLFSLSPFFFFWTFLSVESLRQFYQVSSFGLSNTLSSAPRMILSLFHPWRWRRRKKANRMKKSWVRVCLLWTPLLPLMLFS